MEKKMRNNKDPMDGFFKIFPYIFITVFAISAIFMIIQFATVGFVAYKVISDPHGTSNFIGTVAGEVIRPIANAIEGE
jgi:hypothetical protein